MCNDTRLRVWLRLSILIDLVDSGRTAMTAPTAPDVKDDLLLRVRPLLYMSKPELQKVWKEVNCSDFEPVAKLDLLAAILCRRLRGASDLDSAQSHPSSSTAPVASPTNTPTPAKSFKEDVASPARFSDSTKCENRLGEVELSLKEHKDRLWELDGRAEALETENRQLILVVYDVPDTAKEDDSGAETLASLLGKCTPEGYEGFRWEQSRLGTFRPDQERPRPIRIYFKSLTDKHTFLKHAKHLKEINLRYDDDLTRSQQRQRQDMAAEFDTLKSKGHKPFYRGSSLKFRHANKTRTCKKHRAIRALDAQV